MVLLSLLKEQQDTLDDFFFYLSVTYLTDMNIPVAYNYTKFLFFLILFFTVL